MTWLAAVLPALSASRSLSIRSIVELSHTVACQHPQVLFEGIVTHTRSDPADFYVQQNGWGLYVVNLSSTSLEPGDHVQAVGTVQCGTRPFVHASSILKLGHGALPAPISASFTELIHGQHDGALVTVRGSVRSADLNTSSDPAHDGATIRIETASGPVRALIHNTDAYSLESLIDSEVNITGIANAQKDSKQQRTDVVLYVGSFNNIRILRRASADPWTMPLTPLDKVLAASNVLNLSHRVRVQGFVTYQEPGRALALQNGVHSLWIYTESQTPLRIGDEVEAIGFPIVANGFVLLIHGGVHSTGKHSTITPMFMRWTQLASGAHVFDLASIEGYVVMKSPGATEDRYVLNSEGETFTAIARHKSIPSSTIAPPSAKEIPVGALVRVTGICVPSSANYGQNNVPFNILLRSQADLQILKGPSLLSKSNMGIAILVLLLAFAALTLRFWRLERKVRREMATLAYSERRRSRILEQINGTVPLAEIVEQTAELVSFSLQGSPCWVQIAGGARLGNQPSNLAGFSVHEHKVSSRSGPPLGSIFVGFDPHAPAHPAEKEALETASSLIELAIETRKILTDLVHRSEFDLLTDVQNRFALERSLDEQIRSARATAGIFGLVYIDLNGFKQVNDLYGHQIGDLYLKEIALRMKRQLRPGDLLARLGGDEFAILVTNVRSRSDIEEITLRLERCFDNVFQTGDCAVQGSASIGFALYPEDARTRDSLIAAADTAMYGVKGTRGEILDSAAPDT